MDAIKILGSLLGNNAMGSNVGGSILESLFAGRGQGRGGAGNILGSLLGGKRRSSGGGLGALGAILAAALAARSRSSRSGGGSAIDIIGDLLGGGGGRDQLGGLGDLLGGGQQPSRSSGGGLEDLLGNMLGGGSQQGRSGGGLLGELLGGGTSSGGGGLSNIFGAYGAEDSAAPGHGSEMLGLLLGGVEEPVAPPQEAQDEAELLIRAMCNAAKADGKIDQGEQDAILGRMGELDQKEIEYLRTQLTSPLDLQAFIDEVPEDMAEQVYAFSLMAIRLDTQAEAQYFAKLAAGLGVDGDTANDIHERLGQPEIFS